jgi:hypothetical protein
MPFRALLERVFRVFNEALSHISVAQAVFHTEGEPLRHLGMKDRPDQSFDFQKQGQST